MILILLEALLCPLKLVWKRGRRNSRKKRQGREGNWISGYHLSLDLDFRAVVLNCFERNQRRQKMKKIKIKRIEEL
jgi:hypothetical protein